MIIVAGQTRCGSSLTMQMLHKCGLKCAGDFPSFEAWQVMPSSTIKPDWLNQFDAVKMLDVHLLTLPNGLDAKVIWLDRNPVDQAASILKFYAAISGDSFREKDIPIVSESLKRDREKDLAKFDWLDIHFTSFERAINNTCEFVADICHFLTGEYGDQLSMPDMVDCVLARKDGSKPEPGLEIELNLIRDKELTHEAAT